jgi:hypothetical protein
LNDDFNKYLDANCNDDWIKKNESDFSLFSPYFLATDHSGKNPVRNFSARVSDLREERQAARKQSIAKINESRKAIVKELLSAPDLSSLKDLYENITSCENSTLN